MDLALDNLQWLMCHKAKLKQTYIIPFFTLFLKKIYQDVSNFFRVYESF